MNSELNIASISDIHLGHKNTKTEDIVANLMAMFPDNRETANLDIIFIAGDVFDGLLMLPDHEIKIIHAWIHYMVRLCKHHDILLRVLEGTPSHDRRQSELFVYINSIMENSCDLKYAKTLEIEYIAKLGINVLYIPDEYRSTTEETWGEVLKTLAAHNLKEVDFVVMHGTFEHQLPPHIKSQKHSNDNYESITKYLVFVGHIHLHSVKGKIVAHGSADRISHGEEGPKGHVRVRITKEDEVQIKFIENTNAKIYKTIDCRGLSYEAAIDKITMSINVPVDSFIRIQANRDDPILTAIDSLRKKYAYLNWSTPKVTEGTLGTFKELQENLKITKTGFNITPNNIVDLTMQRVKLKIQDPVLIERARKLLEGLANPNKNPIEVNHNGISGS